MNRRGWLSWYFGTSLLLRILIGLVAGAVAGLVFGEQMEWVVPFGSLFVRLLQMIVMPIVIFTLVVGAASVQPSRLGRIGVKSLAFYLLTSAFAVALGLLFGNLFRPGEGMQLTGVADAVGSELQRPSLIDTLLNVVPTNPFGAIAEGNILPTIFAALLFGLGLAHSRDSDDERIKTAAETVYRFFEGGAEIMYKCVHWILEYGPIGVFALIAVVFGRQGAVAFGPLLSVTMTVYLALAAHLLLVYGGLLAVFRLNPWRFLYKSREASVTAFVTRSSGGTLPVSMEVAEEKMGISRGVYAFILPLGATINMDGTAIYQGVCAVFVGLAIGLPLDFQQQMLVILTALLASIGTAGVPGAGAIMLLMVLESVGFKMEPGTAVAAAYAMIFGIDALLDMGRTSLNVTGNLAAACIVAKTEHEMDLRAWTTADDES